MRLVRRHGQPLLLLPAHATAARTALSLYPAQSWKARLARTTLAALQSSGLTLGAERVEIPFVAGSAFAQFLRPPGDTTAEFTFALLLGNPNVSGRRFVLLMFNRAGQPVRVVKAGVGPHAAELIRREATFLKSIPAETLHAPKLLGEFAETEITALALEYLPGPTPKAAETQTALAILTDWIDATQTVRFGELPAAQRLHAHARPDDATRRALAKFAEISFHPALHHGDFVPWNMRANPATGNWAVLDWERGEQQGPPAWDWFHFVIQPLALVRRAAPDTILAQVEALRRQPEFLRYAARADIENHFDILLLGYLLTCRDVIRQAEGMPTIEGLAKLISQRLA